MSRLTGLAVALALGSRSLAAAPLETPPDQRRAGDQTFLTGPEWFLVFSPAEFADYINGHPPSGFPFYGHIRQFWQGYHDVATATGQYPVNYEYHVMIWVIGVSTTIEYAVKGLYEGIVGRFTEQVAGKPDTAEDRLAERVAQDYVAFIKKRPWYEFDFMTPLKSVWRETGLWGDKPFRKWERKYFLTSEYMLKAVYGWVLGKATRASYDVPIGRTFIIADGIPGDHAAWPTDVKLEQDGENGAALISLPRYQAFTDAATALAAEGLTFREIAGNRGDILVSIVAPYSVAPELGGRLLYSQPILTKAGLKRFALIYQVADLAPALRGFAKSGITVEHIYDF
jgi:hypothetical protein